MRNMDELNKKRVEHLKNLKREIKILEKIERKISKGETELEDTSMDNSEYSTTKVMESPTRKLTYIKGSARTRNDDTTVTDVFTVSRDAVDEGTTTRQLTKGLGTEDPRFDSSDKSSVLSLLTESSHRSTRKNHVSKQRTTAAGQIISQTETIEVVAQFESQTEDSLMGAPPQHSESEASPYFPSTSASTSASRLFVQRTRHWNKENKRQRTKEKVSKKRSPRSQKPVAYYLPMTSMSPIRLGTKLLKESSHNPHGVLSFNKRNILSQYMANMDHEPPRPRVTIPSRAREDGNKLAKLSLQDALRHKRPDFVRQSEGRVAILHQIREARERRAARHEAWLEEVRCLSPTSRKQVRPVFSPSPVVRLFTHQEMVAATRNKYSVLPEVINQKESVRKEGKGETNRLRKDIYSRQLKRRLQRGKVSLTHHDRVL